MRKFLLLPVMFLTMLATSCSTDDSVKMHEDNSDFKLKANCTNFGVLEQGAILVGDDILFYWSNDNLLHMDRVYITKIEIRNKGCVSSSTDSYTINLFGSESYTLEGGVPAPPFTPGAIDNCFQYRYTAKSYDGLILFCSSTSDWFDFPN